MFDERKLVISSYLCDYVMMRLGPCTAFQFFAKPEYHSFMEDVMHLNNFDISKDYVCPLLGEIDCRVHIGKHLELGIEQACKVVIDKMFLSIDSLLKQGYKVLLMDVHPASNHPNCQMKGCPANGSQEQRNLYTEEFNRQLDKESKSRNIPFIKRFHWLLEMKQEAFHDYVHLSPERIFNRMDKQIFQALSESN